MPGVNNLDPVYEENCTDVSFFWSCVNQNKDKYETIISSAGNTMVALTCIFYVLAMVNTFICIKMFNQPEHSSKSISTVVKAKYVSNMLCLTFWVFVHILVVRVGTSAVNFTSNVLPFCSMCYFSANFFAVTSNWSELFSTFYRFVRSLYPVRMAFYFKSNKLAYVAGALTILVSAFVNTSHLTYPTVIGCQNDGWGHCSVRNDPIQIRLFFILGFFVPITVCLFLLALLVVFKKERVRESHRSEEPEFYRAFTFCMASTTAFVSTNLPLVLFLCYSAVSWPRKDCYTWHVDYIIYDLALAVRHFGFNVDWLIFLVISPLFRYQAASFVRSHIEWFQDLF